MRASLISSRNVLERAFELLRFDANPAREAVLLSQFKGFSDTSLLLGLFAHGDDVARLDVVRRNVHLLAVDKDGAVRNHLAGFSARGAEAHAVNHVVQTGFKKGEKVFTGVAGDTFSFREVTTELTFENAIKTLGLLRFAHLSAVVGRAGSGNLTVLARLP